jgi:predicted ATPase
MLTQLRLQNFKAWRDTGDVRLAPLTVLFGTNSSGKSSINQFLTMLKQTVRSPDRNSVFDTGGEGRPVNLGSFRDFVFRHETERHLCLRTTWKLGEPLDVSDPRTARRYSGERLEFYADVAQTGREARTAAVGEMSYVLGSGPNALAVGMERESARSSRWRLWAENYELIRIHGRVRQLPRPTRFYGFPNEAAAYYQNADFVSDLELELERQLQSLSYLGPLRRPPARLYTWSGGVPEDVGWEGEDTIQALLAGADRRFNWKAKSPKKAFPEVVARWLQTMGLIHDFGVSQIAPGREEYEVNVRVTPYSDEVKLTDVGFGVSQVLPVIVQCFYAAPNSTVMIEQPEIHLHPSVQAALADLFLDAIGARENGRDRNIQLIIESHSEHFLRRLQRRIAEERISEDKVALYFCTPGSEGSIVTELEVDRYGDILNWPRDFFGNEIQDVAIQAELRLERELALADGG